jgi:UDP-glucose 4-epimerase
VTGGAGFVGTHLVKELKSLGYAVEVIDIVLDPNKDVRNLELIKPLFAGVEFVFHLAALTSVPYSIEHPIETHNTNLTGTLNVLLASREAGVKRVVFSSSAAVYGDQEKLPVKESAQSKPMSPYASQKLASEMYLKLFSEIYNLETVSLRYFNLYGQGQDPNGPYASVVPKFRAQKSLGQPLTIIGDGKQTRDFIHIDDVVSANIKAMQSNKVGGGEVINIATGESTTINHVAEIIGGPKDYLPTRLEIKDSVADISLARKLLDWSPQINLEEGIKKLLK